MAGKKVRVYDCDHYEFDYDDLGKFYWCHCKDNPKRECDVDWIFCMKYCPYFKKKPGSFRLVELTERDKMRIEQAKKKLEDWKAAKSAEKAALEQAEYELYLRLKTKYETA